MHEYSVRKTLAKLGFTDDIDSLDADTAEALYMIDQELIRLENASMKKKGKK